jgi:indole-3-glycerol phosphate synthase
MAEFIFMLTHHDVTVPNALELFEEVKDTGLRYIGCKDIGLSREELKRLFRRFKEEGMKSFIEVVTYDENEHFRGVNTALEIGADYLIGGMPQHTLKTLDYLKEKQSKIKFFPYIGKVVGHPCIIEGSIQEILENGKETEQLKADGINLLSYRYTGNQEKLLEAVLQELNIPLIVAGNVDSYERITYLKDKGVWAFTIGGAVLEKKFVAGGTEKEQVEAVLSKIR